MDDPNSKLRSSISCLVSWSETVYKKLANLSNSKLSYNTWLKLVAEYYIDLMNGDGSLESIKSVSKTLLMRTVKKTGRSSSIISEVFKKNERIPYKSLVIKRDLALERKHGATSSEVEALALRYHIVLKSGGHFLSIDTELYQDLSRSSKLPVLECYASPYNHNLEQYCSLFPEDRLFGALPRFDLFIDTINFPCRLIANPPYTVNSLKTCIDKLLKYMARQNGEFVALLPHMHSFPRMTDLLQSDNTASVLLQSGTYLLHDFLTNKDVAAPMLLYIVVNVEHSHTKSSLLASNIAYCLRSRATQFISSN